MSPRHPFTLGAIAALLAAGAAQAAVGDAITYSFNTQSQGNATPVFEQATLLISETLQGVDLTLTANWLGGANRIAELMFVYSGDAFSFLSGSGPAPQLELLSSAKIDSGYVASPYVVRASWDPSGAGQFGTSVASSTWSMNGVDVSLDDFIGTATAVSTKPSPAFGVISMPGANVPGAAGSNWVAQGFTVVEPVPEPETYALMALGLAVVGWAARRNRKAATPALHSA